MVVTPNGKYLFVNGSANILQIEIDTGKFVKHYSWNLGGKEILSMEVTRDSKFLFGAKDAASFSEALAQLDLNRILKIDIERQEVRDFQVDLPGPARDLKITPNGLGL
jgi:hypothetical protein